MGSKRVDLVTVQDAPVKTISAVDLFKECSVIDVGELFELMNVIDDSEEIGKDKLSAFVAKVVRVHPIPKIASTVSPPQFQLRKVLLTEATDSSGKTLAAEVVLFGPYATAVDHVAIPGDVICIQQPHIGYRRPERELPKDLTTAMANFVVFVGADEKRPASRITLVKKCELISTAVERFNPHEPSTSTAALAADATRSSPRRTTKTSATNVERTPASPVVKAAAVPPATTAVVTPTTTAVVTPTTTAVVTPTTASVVTPTTTAVVPPTTTSLVTPTTATVVTPTTATVVPPTTTAVVTPTSTTAAPIATIAPPSSTRQTTTNTGLFAVPTSTFVSKGYTYTNLNDCDEMGSKKYNVWAVITRISRDPSPTKAAKLMAQVYIQDPDYQGSYGYSDYQFSILSNRLEEFPPLSVGSVIRIHHMQVQEFNGSKNGRVYDARGVAVIPGKANDPIVPKFTSIPSLFEFTAADTAKVRELRHWWAEYQRQRDQDTDTVAVSERKICEVTQACVFDLRCKILHIFHTKMRDNKVSVLRVTDGTTSVAYAVAYAEDEDDIRFECSNEGQRHIDIFVRENPGWLREVKEDSFVLLKRVECAAEKLLDSEKVVRLTAFKFLISDGFSFIVLPSEHSTLRELRRNIESDGPAEPQEDLALVELLDAINDSPNKLTMSTMSNNLS